VGGILSDLRWPSALVALGLILVARPLAGLVSLIGPGFAAG
jgi:hypothetical protein